MRQSKAESNRTKRGVSFVEAATVFQDFLAFIFDDEQHSEQEARQIIIGHSDRNRLMLVSFTARGDVIRLISARKVTPYERRDDVASVFRSAEEVNRVLRALIQNMPAPASPGRSS